MNRRTVGIVVASIVALNLAVAVGTLLERSPVVEGPPGSSYVTTPDGIAAWYEMLDRSGLEVRRLRTPIDEAALAGARTLVIAEPGFAPFGIDEIETLRRFVEAGGTLILTGFLEDALLEGLVGFDPEWSTDGEPVLAPWGAPPGGPDEVRAAGFGSWRRPGRALPVLGGNRPVVIAVRVGDGMVHLIADSSVVSNRGLSNPGNARFAATVVGPGPVVFDEFRHGYRDAESALPPSWRRTWPFLALVVAVGLYAAGRRLVPVQSTERELGPGRERYVASLASLLVRSGEPTAVLDALRAEARHLVARRAGLPGDAHPGRFEEAALRLGLDRRTVTAIMGTGSDTETLLTVHRAVASLRSQTVERGTR